MDNIGVVDTTTSTFSTIDVAAAGVTADGKYIGAAAVGGKVYFGPYYQDNNVGVFELHFHLIKFVFVHS